MREQDYVDRAKLSPARTFKSPMDVVQANDLEPAEKLAMLRRGRLMNEPFCAPKMKGWVEASMHIFTRCKRPSTISGKSFPWSVHRGTRARGALECWAIDYLHQRISQLFD